jgi:heme-degrading monooxygenase HmoA
VSIVAITTFRLVDGADESAFLAADRRVQTELVPNQPGFMRRTTARRGDEWLVVTLWWSEEVAAAFDAVASTHEVQHEFNAFVNVATVASSRFDTLD